MNKALTAAPLTPASLLEFARFVTIGSLAAMANLLARFALDPWLPYEVAILIGYLVGFFIAFFMFQRAIFGDPGTSMRRQLFRFTAVNVLGLALTLSISSHLARVVFPYVGWTLYPYTLAHFIGVCAPAFSSYFLHKWYTYADG